MALRHEPAPIVDPKQQRHTDLFVTDTSLVTACTRFKMNTTAEQ